MKAFFLLLIFIALLYVGDCVNHLNKVITDSTYLILDQCQK